VKIERSVLFLIIIGFLIYFNGLFGSFVWDDEEQIVANGIIHSIKNIPHLFLGSTFNPGGASSLGGMYYKPLMSVSFSFLYSVFGSNPFFFHLFQLLIHIANALLVFYFFKYFFNQKAAFFASLFFLIHPVNSEAVLYVSALQDTLFFFFGMLVMNLLKKGSGKISTVFLSAFFLLLSLLSKETGSLFFVVAIVFKFFFEKNKRFLYLFSFFIAGAIYLFLRFAVAGMSVGKFGPSPIMMATFYERLINMPQIAFFYLKTFFWPASLAIDRQEIIREVSFYNFYLPLIFVLLFLSVTGTALFLIYKRNGNNFKICLFFLLWFGLGMGLHLQIFPLDMALAERWFYFPIAGLLGLVLISGSQFNLFNQKKLLYFFVILIIFALSIRTFIRTFDWRNGLTLFSHDIKLSGKSFNLENNLGVGLFRTGRVEEAAIHFENSTKLAPYWWTNWNNLGVIYERQKDFERAGKSYQKAIDNGKYYLAYENLAGLFLNHKKSPKEAKEFIEKSLIDLPNNWKLHYILALSELQLENREPAIQSARKAYQLSPNEQTYRLLKNMATNSP